MSCPTTVSAFDLLLHYNERGCTLQVGYFSDSKIQKGFHLIYITKISTLLREGIDHLKTTILTYSCWYNKQFLTDELLEISLT